MKFSFRNVIVLNNVKHVSHTKKNLVSTFLLVQSGYEVVFESNRVFFFFFLIEESNRVVIKIIVLLGKVI